jgi:hypothetical protein
MVRKLRDLASYSISNFSGGSSFRGNVKLFLNYLDGTYPVRIPYLCRPNLSLF